MGEDLTLPCIQRPELPVRYLPCNFVRDRSDHLITLNASASASLFTRSEERCGLCWGHCLNIP